MDGQGNVRRIRKNERKRLNVSNTIKIWFVLQRFTFLLPLVVRTSFTFYAHKDFRTTNNIIDSLLWLNQSVFIASGSGSLFFLRLFFTLWVLYPVTSLQPLFHNCVYSQLLLDGKCRKKYKCIVLLEITLFSHSSKMNWIQRHAATEQETASIITTITTKRKQNCLSLVMKLILIYMELV